MEPPGSLAFTENQTYQKNLKRKAKKNNKYYYNLIYFTLPLHLFILFYFCKSESARSFHFPLHLNKLKQDLKDTPQNSAFWMCPTGP